MEFSAVIDCLNSLAIVRLTITTQLVLSVEKCTLSAISINFAVFHLVGVR